MPLPGEHAARQLEPSACDRFRRENGRLGPGIDVIWCVRPGKAVEPQSIRFDAKKFTADEARAWLKKHGYSAANFEEASDPARAGARAAAGLLAAYPSELKAAGAGGALELVDYAAYLKAQAAGDPAALPQVSMLAYSGVPMKLENFHYPVVVDLETIKAPRQAVPILRAHDSDRIAGHTTSVDASPQRLKARGVLSGMSQHVADVLQTSARGFPWQVSIGGGLPGRPQFVPDGEVAKVNGRNWSGPLVVARGFMLRELSLLPMGADGNTDASFEGAPELTSG
jgi:hypothetical protein